MLLALLAETFDYDGDSSTGVRVGEASLPSNVRIQREVFAAGTPWSHRTCSGLRLRHGAVSGPLVVNDSDAATFHVGQTISHCLQLIGRMSDPVRKFTNDFHRLPGAI